MAWEAILGALNGFNGLVISYYLLINSLYTLLFLIALSASVGRHRKGAWRAHSTSLPTRLLLPVSFLLPVCNEKEAVLHAVWALLKSNYPDVQIVVINDGSTDGTLEALTKEFSLTPADQIYHQVLPTSGEIRSFYGSERFPGLLLVDKRHSGLADSLNVGINVSHYPYFCPLAANMRLQRNALSILIRPILDDPNHVLASFGAVRTTDGGRGGKAPVGRPALPSGALLRFQFAEQMRHLVFDQIAWSALHSLWLTFQTVAVFQKKAAQRLGGYRSHSTLPDSDLTLRLYQAMGGSGRVRRVSMTPETVAGVLGPQTIRGLADRKRDRHRGVIRELFSNFRLLANSRYGCLGMAAIPFYWLVEVIGPVLEVGGYLSVGLSAVFSKVTLPFVALFLFLAVVYGVFLSVGAVLLGSFWQRRPLPPPHLFRLLGYAVIENFGYRQLSAWWRLQALGRSFVGGSSS